MNEQVQGTEETAPEAKPGWLPPFDGDTEQTYGDDHGEDVSERPVQDDEATGDEELPPVTS